MSSNIINDNYQNDTKLNSLSASFADKTLTPLNGRYRSKSLSSDKLNKANNADRAAILEDVDAEYVTENSETPGCLVIKKGIMDQEAQSTLNGYKDGKASYGTESPARGRRVIFCVHGNPSTGCCAVIETNPDGDETGNGSISEVERHCHRSRNEEIDKRARRKLIIASILCVVFMIGEIVGGYLSNSLAIATDAAHLLTDFASFMISLFSLWVASRPATRRMPFGWYRAEVIGALTSVLLIWVVTGVLVYMAVQRVIYEQFEIDATVMLITSAVGVAVNLVMGLTLHQHGHSHGGGHGHSHGGSNPVLNNKEVANTFLSLPGVVRVHNLRMWALSLDKTALAAHLAIRTGVSPQKILEQATRLVHEKYNFFEMTLQIEEFNDGMEDCSQCKMPQA
ncbi:unnamed protein product [Colias eurytheme]|nr:unnamed protein product [Colias eurytheme]